MNLPVNAEHMSQVHVALEVARHELVTLNSLYVTDDKKDFWKTDTNEAIALLDKAITAIKEPPTNERPPHKLVESCNSLLLIIVQEV